MLLEKLIVALGIDAREYSDGLGDAEKHTKGFGDRVGSLMGGALKLGLAATAGGILGALGAIVSGVASNAEFERYNTQFSVLLGSTEAAQQRLDELAKFGASTPFELPELVKADKILVGFGLDVETTKEKWGRSGAEIRTIAGDVASGTGASFEEMSLLLGKFSAGATGEAISRMAELGIASKAELAAMGLEFDKSGALLSPLPESMTVVLALMEEKYGGMMAAQSATFEGMISNLQDWVSGTLRMLSAPIFEVLKDKLGVVLAFLNDPATQETLNFLAKALAENIGAAIDWLTTVGIPTLIAGWQALQPALAAVGNFIVNTLVPAFMAIVGFITNNAKPILAGLVAVLVAVVVPAFIAWSTAAVAAATATIVALAPVLLPLAAIGVAVGLLYAAWDSNFMGIRDTLIGVWEGYLLPIFTVVKQWLDTNIPIAIRFLSDLWTNTLKPALMQVWAFIQNYIIPIFVALVKTHIAVLKIALQQLANFWNAILWPALKTVYNFISTYIVPIFKALVNVYIAALMLALRTLAGVWNTVIMPALRSAWNFLNTYLVPILKDLYEKVINNGLKPALQSVAFFILGTLVPQFMAVKATISGHLGPSLETAKTIIGKVADAFKSIDSAIKDTISWIQAVADKLNSISIPSWLQGHSPPPMAHWFRYIGEATKSAAHNLNDYTNQLAYGNAAVAAMPGGITGSAASAMNTNTQISIDAQYRYQDELTLREDLRAQAMLWGAQPV